VLFEVQSNHLKKRKVLLLNTTQGVLQFGYFIDKVDKKSGWYLSLGFFMILMTVGKAANMNEYCH
jgi:hypothetical protein